MSPAVLSHAPAAHPRPPARLPAAQTPGDLRFFLCDFTDILPKDALPNLEYPLFSLATNPDRQICVYHRPPVKLTITPSVQGRATLFDKDVLIFATSQLMAALNAGHDTHRCVHMRAIDFMRATGRECSGDGYQRLFAALQRLAGTRIHVHIQSNNGIVDHGFGLLDEWSIVRAPRRTKSTGGGTRQTALRLLLSEWLYTAIAEKSVLTLSPDYFRLRRPLERRIYELARKHCGRQAGWHVSLPVLLEKSGSSTAMPIFTRTMKAMVKRNGLPDYALSWTHGAQRRPRALPLLHITRRVPYGDTAAAAVLV